MVLPAPFGPISSRRSPGMTVSDTSLVAATPPKRLRRPFTCKAGAAHAFTGAGRGRLEKRRLQPGTRPRGMNMTVTMNTSPSREDQRST